MGKYKCVNCGEILDESHGFRVYENGKPTPYYVCDFQCLILWDCTGDPNDGFKGNQALNLASVDLVRISPPHKKRR